MRGATDAADPGSILAAIRTLDVETTLGRANFGASPIPNVAKSIMLGGQWLQTAGGFDLGIAAKPTVIGIPLTRLVESLPAL